MLPGSFQQAITMCKNKMKKYIVVWSEYVDRVATVEAHSEQEAKKKFFNGEIDGEITREEFVEDSLEICDDA